MKPMAYEVKQLCRLQDGEELTFAIGVATERDGEGDVVTRALALVGGRYTDGLEIPVLKGREAPMRCIHVVTGILHSRCAGPDEAKNHR